MKRLVWFIVGIAVGFVLAHVVAGNPKGKRFFDEVDTRAHEFSAAVVEGYKEREAELRDVVSDAVADAGDTLTDLANRSE
jgi:hypothetical protein